MPRKSSAKPPREEKQESSKQASAKIHQFPRRPAKSEPLSEPEPPFMKRRLSKPGLDTEMEPQPRFEAPTYKPAGKLVGKVALITGGDSGIGRAVAVLYAREGADVAIMYLPQEQSDAEQVRAMVEREGRRCLLLPGDVTDPDFCREAVERTVSELGQLDVLVNNAAFQTSQEKLEDLSEDQWEHTFRTNIFGYFYMVKAAMPTPEAGQRHRQHRVDYRLARQQAVARLLVDHRRCSCFHQVAGAKPGGPQDSRQLRSAGTHLDAAGGLRL